MKLEVKKVTKCYGSRIALNHVNLELTNGIYGILGANGAGKSTLMNLLTDNVRRQEGSILLDGKEILSLGKQYRSKVGYMPQQMGIYEQFTGIAFLYYIAELKGISKKAAKQQIQYLLEKVNLKNEGHRKLGGYSGGMKQRILLAQALLGDPDILILDEPTAGLDPKERIRLRDFIQELSQNKIVLLATHIVSDIEFIAKEIILMKEGQIILVDTPNNLLCTLQERKVVPLYGRLTMEDVYLYYLEGGKETYDGIQENILE